MVAIGKYIGEGFNMPRLDTLMLTTPIAWEGNVEQYAGRLHRDYESKKEIIIYDYVDSNIRVLDNMYHKRLRAYRKIGYELYHHCPDPLNHADSIFDADSYLPLLERDMENARKEVIISCPELSLSKTNWLRSIISRRIHDGIRATLISKPPDSYAAKQQAAIVHQHAALAAAGIHLNTTAVLHHRFAIIDRTIVWYGNAHILSKDKADTCLIRISAPDVASDLLSACIEHKQNGDQLLLL